MQISQSQYSTSLLFNNISARLSDILQHKYILKNIRPISEYEFKKHKTIIYIYSRGVNS